MKFNHLLYFYATISWPSNEPITVSKRKALKQIFDGYLKTPNNTTKNMLISALPNNEVQLENLLGDNEDKIKFKNVIVEMKQNPDSVLSSILAHSKEIEVNYYSYIHEQIREKYTALDDAISARNQKDTQNFQDARKIGGGGGWVLFMPALKYQASYSDSEDEQKELIEKPTETKQVCCSLF